MHEPIHIANPRIQRRALDTFKLFDTAYETFGRTGPSWAAGRAWHTVMVEFARLTREAYFVAVAEDCPGDARPFSMEAAARVLRRNGLYATPKFLAMRRTVELMTTKGPSLIKRSGFGRVDYTDLAMLAKDRLASTLPQLKRHEVGNDDTLLEFATP